jgi:hypothetical protein
MTHFACTSEAFHWEFIAPVSLVANRVEGEETAIGLI